MACTSPRRPQTVRMAPMSPTECSAALADAQGTISLLKGVLAFMIGFAIMYVAVSW